MDQLAAGRNGARGTRERSTGNKGFVSSGEPPLKKDERTDPR